MEVLTPKLSIRNMNKSFDGKTVLNNLNFDLMEGEFLSILGPSGCGKTTLLRILIGLDRADSGQILKGGRDISDLPSSQRGMGIVFQNYALFPNMTVLQNVEYALTLRKETKKEARNIAMRTLEQVGLMNQIHKYPNQLSGGQQQRVALARAIVTEPKVLLLDEPLSAIDALLRHNLQIEIRRIQRELNITTIFVTHDQDEAMVMSDTIHLFNKGNVEQSGTPVELYTKPATKFAASFIGNYNLIPAAKFGNACGDNFECEDIAIRPEIVRISKEAVESDSCYQFKGKIVSFISHGNVIRFRVECEDIWLNADVVFERELAFEEGDEVYVTIEKDLVIKL